MTTCLKYLVPIACFLFIGVVVYPLVLLTVLGRTTLLPGTGPFAEPIGERVPVPVVRQPIETASAVVDGPAAVTTEEH